MKLKYHPLQHLVSITSSTLLCGEFLLKSSPLNNDDYYCTVLYIHLTEHIRYNNKLLLLTDLNIIQEMILSKHDCKFFFAMEYLGHYL
jgi:hypothetical protein